MITCNLRLCETEFLFLKPNVNYVFTVDENCKYCKALERLADGYNPEDYSILKEFENLLANWTIPDLEKPNA